MDNLMVFGPGLMAAYRLETQEAIYPRIVLQDSVADLAFHHVHEYYGGDFEHAPQGEYLTFGWDHKCFVNYLSASEILGSSLETVQFHKRAVEQALLDTRTSPRVHEKFVWLANFHNHYCDLKGLTNEIIGTSYRHLEFFSLSEWRKNEPDRDDALDPGSLS
jgi:hypothetical protein